MSTAIVGYYTSGYIFVDLNDIVTGRWRVTTYERGEKAFELEYRQAVKGKQDTYHTGWLDFDDVCIRQQPQTVVYGVSRFE